MLCTAKKKKYTTPPLLTGKATILITHLVNPLNRAALTLDLDARAAGCGCILGRQAVYNLLFVKESQ